MLIGPHTGEDDEVLLSALEGIDTGHLQLLREGGGGGGKGRERYMHLHVPGEGGREGGRDARGEACKKGEAKGTVYMYSICTYNVTAHVYMYTVCTVHIHVHRYK